MDDKKWWRGEMADHHHGLVEVGENARHPNNQKVSQ
jgi:hypothetical protein